MLPAITEENVLSALQTFLEELKDFRTLSICWARLIRIRWKLSQLLLELQGTTQCACALNSWLSPCLAGHTYHRNYQCWSREVSLALIQVNARQTKFSVILINKLDYHKIKLMTKHFPRAHSSSSTITWRLYIFNIWYTVLISKIWSIFSTLIKVPFRVVCES